MNLFAGEQTTDPVEKKAIDDLTDDADPNKDIYVYKSASDSDK